MLMGAIWNSFPERYFQCRDVVPHLVEHLGMLPRRRRLQTKIAVTVPVQQYKTWGVTSHWTFGCRPFGPTPFTTARRLLPLPARISLLSFCQPDKCSEQHPRSPTREIWLWQQNISRQHMSSGEASTASEPNYTLQQRQRQRVQISPPRAPAACQTYRKPQSPAHDIVHG